MGLFRWGVGVGLTLRQPENNVHARGGANCAAWGLVKRRMASRAIAAYFKGSLKSIHAVACANAIRVGGFLVCLRYFRLKSLQNLPPMARRLADILANSPCSVLSAIWRRAAAVPF
ncbi:hypothetical protein [Kingella oralis]|jgi:hypothetical protein|uniref:hypothetical protein n=1 Tax=Kingella oralis TaxID=505 RepID=UPI0028EF8F79|nr:hypothetical protein [Kingella oralis]